MNNAIAAALIFNIILTPYSSLAALTTTVSGPEVAQYGSTVILKCSWTADDLVFRILWRVQSAFAPSTDPVEFTLKNSPNEPKMPLSSADPSGTLQGEVAVDSKNSFATLTLRNVTFAAEGNYTCSISSVTAEKSLTRPLRIIAPPAQMISRLNLSTTNSSFLEDGAIIGPYFEGTGFEINCFVANSRPPAEVRWLRKDPQGRLFPLENQSSPASRQMEANGNWRVNRLLRFRLDSRHLMGSLLICQAENEATTQPIQISYRLDMLVPPTNISMSPVGRLEALREGSNYNYTCETRNAKPFATITWTLDREPVTRFVRNETIPQPDGSITTHSVFSYNANPDDNGKLLSCIATQEVLTVQRRGMADSTMLSVYYSPRNIMTSKTQLSVVEFRRPDTDLTGGIQCKADSNPPASFVWMRDGSVIATGAALFFNRSLTRQDAGDYYCVASNDIGRTNISLSLNVQYAPYCARCGNSSDPCLIGIEVGQQQAIHCEMDANPPTNMLFSWNVNQTDMDDSLITQPSLSGTNNSDTAPQGSSTSSSTQLITLASSSLNYTVNSNDDYRRVQCWAKNSVGLSALPCYYQIVPAGPPRPPENCSIITVMSTGFTLKCRPGFDGGYPQRFLLAVAAVNEVDTRGNKKEQGPLTLPVVQEQVVENEFPEFLQRGLLAGRDYQLRISSRNDVGFSQPVVLSLRTLNPEDGPALSTTVIAAIAGSLGGFAFVLLIVSVIYLCVRRRKKGDFELKQPPVVIRGNSTNSDSHSNSSSSGVSSTGGSKSELVSDKAKGSSGKPKDASQITGLKIHPKNPKMENPPAAPEITYARAVDLQSKKPSVKPVAAPKPPSPMDHPSDVTQYAVIDFTKNGKRNAPKPLDEMPVHEAVPVTITPDGNIVHESVVHLSKEENGVIRTVAVV